MTIGSVLIQATVLIFLSSFAYANDIYVRQVGDDLDLDIVQDGENNQVEGLNGSGDAVLSGNDKTTNLTQTGNTNQYRIWTSGNDQIITATVDGNNNTQAIDNHGNDNDITIDIDGNSTATHTEIGNGGDTNNAINVVIDNGDSNTVYTEVQNGSTNNIDIQIHEQSNNINRVTVNGSSNSIKAWQGKHEDGSVDANETGDNDVYWIVSGSNNTLASYQTDDNGNGGQHIANYVTGNSNTVKHTQRGASDHKGFVEITGDGNNVELLQRGNSNVQFADIVLDDGHTVDVHQRYADHTANITLSNGGGGYNLDLTQHAGTNQSYTLTGTCATALGCGLIVTQN